MEGETPPQDTRDDLAETLVSAPERHTLRLPMPPTPFIGREREVAEVCALLGRNGVRLLTLIGPGGIGKTRLSLAVAEALHGEFPDDVYCVSLAPLTDAGLVLPTIAQALGMLEAREVSALTGHSILLERLQDVIGHRKVLLVLDNFEQVIGAAADVAALLSGCARLKVMVTSREMLRVSAEHLYPVPPMALPDLGHLPPLEFLAQVEAVRLFVTRAQATLPDFMLTPENGTAVAAICHRLDGLPLAIELAAARVRLLPPVAMLDRLDQRLALLTGGARDAPARHQTLRATISWSYDLLGPDEQELFRRLAVFAGGCTLEAVEAICRGSGIRDQGSGIRGEGTGIGITPGLSPGPRPLIPDALEVLASLMDKSLLKQDDSEGREGRLEMLETIREYALEQLGESGETETMRLAHAQYYLGLAEEAEPKMTGPEQQVWLAKLEREHDNLRAALAWALGGVGDSEIGARLAASLWRFWFTHGHLSEGKRWLEVVLAGGHSLLPPLRARALNGAGRLAIRQGDFASAQAMLEEGLALYGNMADIRGEMQTRHGLGLVALYEADFMRAQSYFEQNLVGWCSLSDKQGIAQTLNNLGLALRYQDDFERAAESFEECLVLVRERQDQYGIAAALHNLGQMAHHRGDDPGAHRLLKESLLIGRQIGDRPNISARLADLAGVWATQGQPERAARLFGAAEALREQTGAIMYGGQRQAYTLDVERAAAQLDDATWKARWAEGRSMSLDDACDLATEELPNATFAPKSSALPTLQNTYDLSERELEVLRLLVAGLTYDQIAERLMLSFHTVHAHLRSIYRKLGVSSRKQATRFAAEQGIM